MSLDLKTISAVIYGSSCAAVITTAFLLPTSAAGQEVPTIINITSTGNTGAAPNGIYVTPSELLFTQPFCDGKQTRGIYSVNIAANTSSLVSTIPTIPASEDSSLGLAGCAENDIAISAGLGGFKAGDTYVTGLLPSTPTVGEAVYKNGTTPFITTGIPYSKHHASVTFDNSGTFGFDLIVGALGVVNGYSSTGTLQFTYPLPSGYTNYVAAAVRVAPLTYSSCPGCLFMTATSINNIDVVPPSNAPNGAVFYVKPGTASGSAATLWSTMPGLEPEGIVFVENNLSCSLKNNYSQSSSYWPSNFGGNWGFSDSDTSGFIYFVNGYGTGGDIDTNEPTSGAILGFTGDQLQGYEGQVLIHFEGETGAPGVIDAFSSPGVYTRFSQTSYQLEASTILSCPSTTCPVPKEQYKQYGLPPKTPCSIGSKNYQLSDLQNVLNENVQYNDALAGLAQELVGALGNYAAGANHDSGTDSAIGSALALINSNNLDITKDKVNSNSPLGQQCQLLQQKLNSYNHGQTVQCSLQQQPGQYNNW